MGQKSVRIMMATYNGEKFIGEQIQSIIDQTYENWSMIIQDDGSKDETWNIIVEYAKKDSRIEAKSSPEHKHGAFVNFFSIINQEKKSGRLYDYYMFSDQDDIWDKDKIERMISFSEKLNISEPFLVFCDMRVVNAEGDQLFDSISKKMGTYYNPQSLFFSHSIHGCRFFMNQNAFFSVPMIDLDNRQTEALSHDNLYTKYVAMLGKVIYMPEVLMSHRRHGGNTTDMTYRFQVSRALKRVTHLNQLAKYHSYAYRASLITINMMRKNDKINQNELDEMEYVIKTGGLPALIYSIKKKINWGTTIKNHSHRLILLFGLYKKYLALE